MKVVDVSTDSSDVSRRLSDLRRAQPADSTMQNLLVLLSAKLELCARLPVYEYEAGSEGHPACAETFHKLADVERESFNQLLGCLQHHLESRPAGTAPAHQRGGWR
jgi:hypothetical protein